MGYICGGCSHAQWDHYFEEDWDNIYFGPCTVEGCDCKSWNDYVAVWSDDA